MTRPAPHATLVKFGYPASLVHEGEHWAVLVRPAQPTLGCLVLCALGEERAYGALGAEAFAEQARLAPVIEAALRRFSAYEKLNYLMLMMVDPHVHFHVIPRYEGNRAMDGVDYPDSGWPGLPNLVTTAPATPGMIEALRNAWQAEWLETGNANLR